MATLARNDDTMDLPASGARTETARTKILRKPVLTGAAALIAVGAAFATGWVLSPVTTQAQQIRTEAPRAAGALPSFADIVERVSPAVVSLDVVATVGGDDEADLESLPPEWRRFFEGPPGYEGDEGEEADPEAEEGPRNREDRRGGRRVRGGGSGFFISANGYIVTNHHVVENATRITATLQDGRELPARIIGVDERTDLAVVKVEGANFPFVQFDANARVRVGDWVIAIGSPFGLGGTATAGIVSALGRDVPGETSSSTNISDFIQIDAPINPGNSGGPTFDLAGRVIGVNTAIYSRFGGNVGIGFAVPANIADRVTRELITNGRVIYGWLGVSVGDLGAEMAESFGLPSPRGAVVGGVTAGSPAARAGLRRGDVIVSLDGTQVRSASDLTRRVGQTRVGGTIRLEVVGQGGARRTVLVTIAARPDERALAQASVSADGRGSATPPGTPPGTPPSGAPPSGTAPGTGPGTPSAPRAATRAAMGITVGPMTAEVRERLELAESEGGVVITAVARGTEAFDRGLRAGMALLQVNGRPVRSPEEFASAVEAARNAGRETVTFFVQSQPGGGIFVPVPLEEDASAAPPSPPAAPRRGN